MSAVFIKLYNMSITASYIVLAVIILRLVFKKAPKALMCLLWGLVAIRLICPFSIESVLSLIPDSRYETVDIGPVYIDTNALIFPQISYINNFGAEIAVEEYDTLVKNNAPHFYLEHIWLCGMIAMFLYAIISYLIVEKRTKASIEIDENIFICDNVSTPFILGVFNPQIFIPSSMDKTTAEYVILHEQAHLNRLDHLWKPLGFALLAVYWFNPVIWVAYILFCRDIELACDERVIKNMDADDKKAYSTALLSCSIPRKMISACPLAFGEVGVKQRIKRVLNYKKPAFWLIVAAIVTSVAVAVCFLTDPKEKGVYPVEHTFAYTGETANPAIFTSAINSDMLGTDEEHHLPVHIFDSVEDIATFKETYADMSFSSAPIGYKTFDEVTEKYDKDFFKDRVVLAIYVPSSRSGEFEFTSIGFDMSREVSIREMGEANDTAHQGILFDEYDIRIAAYTDYILDNEPQVSTEDVSSSGEVYTPESSYSITSTLAFVGITENYAIYSDAINTDKHGLDGEEHLLFHKFESVDDITAFKEKFSDFQFSHNLDLLEFNDIAANYTDEFFEDNIVLVAHTVTAGKGNYVFNTTHISKPNITFYIDKKEEDSDALYGWLLCITIDRKTAEGCTYFDAVIE